MITISLTNLSAGKHSLVVRVSDASTNRNEVSLTILLDVPVKEAREKQVVSLGLLAGGEVGTAVLENADVTEITVRIENLGENQPIQDLRLSFWTAENIRHPLPEDILAYSYFEISTTAPPDAIAWVDVKFRVANEWINTNDAPRSAVALYHLEENEWMEAPTKKIAEDDTFTYYVARTQGFSLFAIGLKTVFPTFELRLPQDPIEMKGEHVEILLWATNPTTVPVTKSLELKFNGHIRVFEVNVGVRENKLVRVYVMLGKAASGTWEVELRDANAGTLLDRGQITLLAASGIPTGVEVPLSPTWLLIISVTSIGVGLGAICIYRRMKKAAGVEPFYPKRRPVAKLRVDVGGEPAEAPSLIQEYYELLLPVARKTLRKELKREKR
jgi:PGF-pre-PGF domain-containing protein